MKLLSFLYPALLSLLILTDAATTTAAKKKPKDAILLSNVKSLTLHATKKTSHRRVSAIPQLSCHGPGCKHHTISILRCTNQGADYNAEDIQWSCTADLPAEFKLGETEVICEGYDSPDDERVLKGSCGVRYRLLLTDVGDAKYGSSWWGGSKDKGHPSQVDEGGVLGTMLFALLFVAVAGWILYSMYLAYLGAPGARRAPRRAGGRGDGGGWGGGGGGGGGGGDPWDPPPPYPGKPSSASAQEGWRPGFWTGALGGAAAGYAAGSRGQRWEPMQQRNNGWFGGGDSSGWGGPSTRPSPSRRSGSSSETTHVSTGFGSTSRR